MENKNLSPVTWEEVNGRKIRVRWHLDSYTRVGHDGHFLKKRVNGQEVDAKYMTDPDGERYLVNAGKQYYVKNLVNDCFGSPMPDDGQDWVLAHKDGNVNNNHIANLEWKLRKDAFPSIPASQSDKVKLDNGIEVHRNGSIYHKGRKLHVETTIYDSDTDCTVPIPPLVRYEYKNRWGSYNRDSMHIDDAMSKAGYVKGNRRQHRNPKILHIDNDPTNFAADNLEWVDESDKRYIDYYNHCADIHNQQLDELNNGIYPASSKRSHI